MIYIVVRRIFFLLTFGMDIDISKWDVVINLNLMCLELANYWLSMGNKFIFIDTVREL